MNFYKYPAVPPAVAMACGVLLCSAPSTVLRITAALLAVGTIVFAGYTHRRGSIPAACFLLLGAVLCSFFAPPAMPRHWESDKQLSLEGTILRQHYSHGNQRIVLRCDSAPHLRVAFTVRDAPFRYNIGDRIWASGYPEHIDAHYAIPFCQRTQAADRTCARLLTDAEHTGLIESTSPTIRDRLADAFAESELSQASAGLLASAWLGDDSAEPEIRDSFRLAGLSHLLCVSGFHLGIITSAAFMLLFWLNFRPETHKLRYWLTIALAWVFAVVSGFQPPVIRAAVMLSVYFLARITERDSSPLNSLAVAVIAILIINPLWIYTLGFQLSVSAVAGIILLAPKLNPVPNKKKVMKLHRVGSMITVPLSALLATAPFVLLHFHHLPMMSVPANMVAALVFPCFMTLGALSVLFDTLGWSLGWLTALVEWLRQIMENLCGMCESLGEGPLSNIYISSTTFALLLGALLFLVLLLHSPARFRGACALAMLTCVLFIGVEGSAPAREIVVHNSRYGTALGIITPDTAIVVHSGNRIPPQLDNYFKGRRRTPAHLSGDFTTDHISRRGDYLLAGNQIMSISTLSAPEKSYTLNF